MEFTKEQLSELKWLTRPDGDDITNKLIYLHY